MDRHKITIETALLDNRALGTLPDKLWRRYIELCLLSSDYEEITGRPYRLPPAHEIAWYLRISLQDLINDLESLSRRYLVSKMDDTGAWWQLRQTDNITITDIVSPWHKVRLDIIERDNEECVYCGGDGTEADHIFPKSMGGANSPSNLVASCKRCNSSKNAKLAYEWYSQQDCFSPKRWEYILAVQNGQVTDLKTATEFKSRIDALIAIEATGNE